MEFSGWKVMLQSSDLGWKSTSSALPASNPALSGADNDFHSAVLSHQAEIAAAVSEIHSRQEAAVQEARLAGFPPPSTLARFYRVREESGLDTDGDGLSDTEELARGLNLFETDTDGDGMDDHFEVTHGLDARNDADADADPDGDGFTNAEEFAAGTDPNVPDADCDGLPDTWESAWSALVLATIDTASPPAHLDTILLGDLQAGDLQPLADYTADGLTTLEQFRATPDPQHLDPNAGDKWVHCQKSFSASPHITINSTSGLPVYSAGSGVPLSWLDPLAPANAFSVAISGLAALETSASPSWVLDHFADHLPANSLAVSLPYSGDQLDAHKGSGDFWSATPDPNLNITQFGFNFRKTWVKAWRPVPATTQEVRQIMRLRKHRSLDAPASDPWVIDSLESVTLTIPPGRTTSDWVELGPQSATFEEGLRCEDSLLAPEFVVPDYRPDTTTVPLPAPSDTAGWADGGGGGSGDQPQFTGIPDPVNYEQDKEVRHTPTLKVAKMEFSLDANDRLHPALDPDHYRVRVRLPYDPNRPLITAKLQTMGDDGQPLAAEQEVKLRWEPRLGTYLSRPMVLVADPEDNVKVGPDVVDEGDPEQTLGTIYTQRTVLGGRIRITSATVGPQNIPVTIYANVPWTMHVNVRPVVFTDCREYLAPADPNDMPVIVAQKQQSRDYFAIGVNMHMNRLKQRCAQVGLKCNIGPIEWIDPTTDPVHPCSLIDMAPGSHDAHYLASHYAVINQPRTYTVYYCGGFFNSYNNDDDMDGYTPFLSGGCFVSEERLEENAWITSHELGHMFTRQGHYGRDYERGLPIHMIRHNLMRGAAFNEEWEGGISDGNFIQESKRLYQIQENLINMTLEIL